MLFGILKRNIVVFLALVILFFGYKCHEEMPLEAYPDIANMQVRVITQVPGKAAEEVERLVTVPLEKELNGIPHAEPPRSVSIFGLSVITIVFDDDISSNVAQTLGFREDRCGRHSIRTSRHSSILTQVLSGKFIATRSRAQNGRRVREKSGKTGIWSANSNRSQAWSIRLGSAVQPKRIGSKLIPIG